MSRIKMPPSGDIAKAYEEGIGKAPDRYRRAVERVDDWQGAAIRGQGNYVEQMSKPDVLARRAEKLGDVSDSEWKAAASGKGARNIGPGMRDGAAKRTRNFEPIRNALDGAEIPDRTTDWETNVENRVKGVVRIMKEAAGKL